MATINVPEKLPVPGLNLFKAACVRFIRKGEAGENALTISVSPESLVFTEKGQQINVKVILWDGSNPVQYGDGNDKFLCSTLGSTTKICDNHISWSFITESNAYTFVYRLICVDEFDGSTYNVPFTITYKGKQISRNLSLSFSKGKDGDPGSPGDDGNDGEDALVPFLSNPIVSFPCNSEGKVKTTKNVTVTFSVRRGSTEGVGFSGLSCANWSGGGSNITTSTNATTGAITLSVTAGNMIAEVNDYLITGTYKTYGSSVSFSEHLIVQAPRDGATGPTGQNGRLVYPYGKWSGAIQYNITANTTPMVEHNGKFYYAKASSKNVNPATDVAGTGQYWGLFDNFQAIFTEILMANFAKLASAVFYGDHMISQYGDDDQGNTNVNDYQDFEDGSFLPYIDLNFRTGAAIFNKATIRGHIEAQSGSFNGFLRTSLIDIETTGAATRISTDPYTYKLTDKFNLSFNSDRVHQLKLPNDASYIGARVVLVSPNMYPYTTTTVDSGVGVYCESGKIYGYATTAKTTSEAASNNGPDVYFIGGVCEILCIPPVSSSYKCNWAIASNNCVMLIKTTLTSKP